jgi:hypothetical protein
MKRASLWAIIGLFLTSGSGYGTLISWRPLLDLEQSADLIVVATANAGSQTSDAVSFKLQVHRVLKGDAIVGGLISADWPKGANALAGGASSIAGTGLWFLQRSSSGWILLPIMQGTALFNRTFIPEPSGPILSAYSYDPTAPLSDKVASEVCAAIEGANGGGHELADLQFDLDKLASPVVMVLYQRMSAANSAEQKILGLSGLIRGGNTVALRSAIQATSALTNPSVEYGVLLRSIQDEYRAVDSVSVAALGQAAVNSSLRPDFRRSAAHALRAIHTIEAVPFLATLLDDPDANLQTEGVGGLASFANGLPVQTTAGVASLSYLHSPESAPYKTTDTVANFAMGEAAIRYLSFWKSWWSQNRTALGY